jgi:hypothetical protein
MILCCAMTCEARTMGVRGGERECENALPSAPTPRVPRPHSTKSTRLEVKSIGADVKHNHSSSIMKENTRAAHRRMRCECAKKSVITGGFQHPSVDFPERAAAPAAPAARPGATHHTNLCAQRYTFHSSKSSPRENAQGAFCRVCSACFSWVYLFACASSFFCSGARHSRHASCARGGDAARGLKAPPPAPRLRAAPMATPHADRQQKGSAAAEQQRLV